MVLLIFAESTPEGLNWRDGVKAPLSDCRTKMNLMMSMKHCIFLSVALCCLTAASYAQGSLPGFKEYARFARRGTGVELSVPGKFEVLQSDSACWSPRERKKAGVTPLYSYMLRSEDGDCVAFYPEMSRLITFYLAEVLTKPAYLRESSLASCPSAPPCRPMEERKPMR